jgi:S-DNA-T family DNA segregation ATPase FtsK/SpoIIIE
MAKSAQCPIELTMTVPEEKDWRQGACELAALGLWALAFYALLSLVSHDASYDPNFAGALGDGLARTLERTFGYQAYGLVPLLACLGRAVWAATPIRLLLRYTAGGAILLVALSTAGGLCKIPMVSPGGATGAMIAAALPGNFSGAHLIILLAIGGALALLARRAPTKLAASSNVELARSRASSGAKGRDDPMPRRVPEVNPAPSLGGARGGDEAPPRTVKPSLILLGEKALPRPPRVKGGYRLPRLDLLDTPPLEKATVNEAALERSARVLEQKLAGFGVQGQVVEVQPGPVVTMYKLEPGEGVKVSQIVNLADDLSLALRAASVRIQAPIPGEAVVGIEVPNRKREKVYLRELLEAKEFKASASPLTIALGKDIAGCPVWADLAAMPHLLIAGATGTGKSVSIHAMVASILFKATADDVRFILIDPKMLELSVYEGIPHLLVPVVVDLEKAAAALLWATGEMEARYRVMRELGVRNIDSYNRTIGQSRKPLELRRGTFVERASIGEQEGDTSSKHRRLPKVVIVIDELADLLLSQGKTVERDITRLAQQARAAGIHLMLATQRPSVDVVTGLQGESAGANFIAGNFAGRFTYDSRCNWRRALAGRRRYAVYAAGHRQTSPLARSVRFRGRDSKALRFSASPGFARLSDGDPRNPCNGWGRQLAWRGSARRALRRSVADRARQRAGIDLDDSAAAQNRVPLGQDG